MSIKQLTVFVENKQGAMVSITETLAENNVNLRALSIAETKDSCWLNWGMMQALWGLQP